MPSAHALSEKRLLRNVERIVLLTVLVRFYDVDWYNDLLLECSVIEYELAGRLVIIMTVSRLELIK